MEENLTLDRNWIINQIMQECDHIDKQVEKHKQELSSQNSPTVKIPHSITVNLAEEIKRCNDSDKYPESFFRGGEGDKDSWGIYARRCDRVVRDDDGFLALVYPSSDILFYTYYSFSFKRLVYGDKKYKVIMVKEVCEERTLPPLPEKCTSLPLAVKLQSPTCMHVSIYRVDEQSGEIASALYQRVEYGWRYDISDRVARSVRWVNPNYIPAMPFDFAEREEYGEITRESVDMSQFEKGSIEAAKAYERRYELNRRDDNMIGMRQAYCDIVKTYKSIYGVTADHPDLVKAIKRHIFYSTYIKCNSSSFKGLMFYYNELLEIKEANLPADHPEVVNLQKFIADLKPLVDDEEEADCVELL